MGREREKVGNTYLTDFSGVCESLCLFVSAHVAASVFRFAEHLKSG